MSKFPPLLLIFPALAAFFLCMTFADARKHGSKITPAGKAWLRIGLIVSAVSVYLLFSKRLFHG
jgi:hypothetical protein